MNLPVFRYPYYTSPGRKNRQIQRSHALSDVHKSLPLQYPHSFEYYGAAEPPVRCGESHLSGLTEPPHFVY